MQDRPRHDPRSPRHIPDAPCKLSCTVPSGTARYVIGSWILDSLHASALPVGRIVRPGVARICGLLHINARGIEYVPSSLSDDVDLFLSLSLSPCPFFSLSSVPLVPSLFLPREHTDYETRERRRISGRKLRYPRLKSILTPYDARPRFIVDSQSSSSSSLPLSLSWCRSPS